MKHTRTTTKKILSVFLALLMVILSVPFAFANDVWTVLPTSSEGLEPDDYWFDVAGYANYLADEGLDLWAEEGEIPTQEDIAAMQAEVLAGVYSINQTFDRMQVNYNGNLDWYENDDPAFLFLKQAPSEPEVLASGEYGTITWSLTDDGTLTVGGTGAIEPLVFEEVAEGVPIYYPWDAAIDELLAEKNNTGAPSLPEHMMQFVRAPYVQEIIVEEGITSIYAGAFYRYLPRRIVLPASLNEIGEFAFNAVYAEEIVIKNPSLVLDDSILLPAYVEETLPVMYSYNGSISKIKRLTELYEAYYKKIEIALMANEILGGPVMISPVEPVEGEGNEESGEPGESGGEEWSMSLVFATYLADNFAASFIESFLNNLEIVKATYGEESEEAFSYTMTAAASIAGVQPQIEEQHEELEAFCALMSSKYGFTQTSADGVIAEAFAKINEAFGTSFASLDDIYLTEKAEFTRDPTFNLPIYGAFPVDSGLTPAFERVVYYMDYAYVDGTVDEINELMQEIVINTFSFVSIMGAPNTITVSVYDEETGEYIGEEEIETIASPWLTVYGYEGSTAQAAAEASGVNFVSLGEAPSDPTDPHVHSYLFSGEITRTPTCIDPGEGIYTCECGESETREIGIDPTNHVNTENKAAVASTCTVKGFTAGVYCNDCETWVSGHEEAALDTTNHVNTENKAAVASTCTVKGFTAGVYCNDCKTWVSGHEEAALDTTNHVNTENKAAVASNCKETGFTAGVYCNDCKTWVSGHEVVGVDASKHAELNENGDCTRCGKHVKDIEKPTEPTTDSDNEPDSGRSGLITRIIDWFRNLFAKILSFFGLKK